jgi:cytidylate kinase
MPLHRNIAICGLTAAGKTTHAKLLAAELGFGYVSGTGTLARLLGLSVTEDPPYWPDIEAQVAERRTDDTDRELEAELLEKATNAERQVFDVWALPWTSEDPGLIRIWIESTLQSRVWKCRVSQGDNAPWTLQRCRDFVETKDEDNHRLFRRTPGFDLYRQRDVFNVALDNSGLISAPTRAAADAGIASFAPVMRAVTELCHGKTSSEAFAEIARAHGTPVEVKWLYPDGSG